MKNMIMTPRLSKAVLTSHITFSIGWLGAVATFLALAITGLTTINIQLARSAYMVMELSGWFVIVPFCIASLVTGIIQATGSKWGLFKHYWIVVKLFLTVTATILLLLHMQPISYLSGVASNPTFSSASEVGLRIQLISDAGAAILLLLIITTISVYKPWGKIQLNINKENFISGKPLGFYLLLIFTGILLLGIVIHLFGGGIHH